MIVTNSDNTHAARLVDNLRAPFDTVITAEEMGVSPHELLGEAALKGDVEAVRRELGRHFASALDR